MLLFGTTIYIWWSWKFKFYVPEIIYLLLLSISDQHNLVIYKFQSVHQKQHKINIVVFFSWTYARIMDHVFICHTISILACNLHILNLCTNTIYIYFLKFQTWVWLGFEPKLAKTSGILVQCPNHYTMGSDICLNYLTYICTV